MPVYIMSYEGEEHEHVKIGWAYSVPRRMKTFRCGNYKNVVVLRTIDSVEWGEKWMHKRFAHVRIKREWFKFLPEMMDVTIPEHIDVNMISRGRLKPRKDLWFSREFTGFPDFNNKPVFKGERISQEDWIANSTRLEADGWKWVGQIGDLFYIRKLISGPMPDNTPNGWIG